MPHERGDELVEIATRALDEWPWRTGSLTISTGMLARAVLSAVSQAGWVQAEEVEHLRERVASLLLDESTKTQGLYAAVDELQQVYREARAQAEALRGPLADLVRLKDGPRDDAYRAEKDAAWESARAALRAYRKSQEPDHAA